MLANKVCGGCLREIAGEATECPECGEFAVPSQAVDLTWTSAFRIAIAIMVVSVVAGLAIAILMGIWERV